MTFEKGHALLIGIGLYGNIRGANVPIATSDAYAVAAVLKDPNTCGYPPENVKLLLNEAATKAGTLAALDELAASVREEIPSSCFTAGTARRGKTGTIISSATMPRFAMGGCWREQA